MQTVMEYGEFQFTLPCRERPTRRLKGEMRQCFNSRSRVGSDFGTQEIYVGADGFQFTLPCRERPAMAVPNRDPLRFQFTLPCRERPRRPHSSQSDSAFQFTLPCRERQMGALAGVAGRGVSIHAPV